jgi:tight adherence protein B
MGAALGLIAGAGLVLMYLGLTTPSIQRRPALSVQVRSALVKTSLTFAVATLVALAVSQSLPVALMLGGALSVIPWSRRNAHARKQQELTREAWPDIVDDLASGVRAGLPLTEALIAAGDRAPEHMGPAFGRFAARMRMTGRVDECLTQLEADLADPIGSRVIDAVRLTREVGGVDIGRVLRTLSAYLREDARLRGEIEARQSLSVNAARMAVAAPWLVLGMLALRPSAVAIYSSATGVFILLFVALVSAVAYRLMRYLGRLPVTSEFA